MDRSIDKVLALQSDPRAGTQAVIDFIHEEPGALTELVAASVRLSRQSPVIDAAFALVPDEHLQRIADESVAAIRHGADTDGQAAALIALLSLQAPHTLGPYLATLWDLRPNKGWMAESWPWRASRSVEDIDRLTAHLADPDTEVRRRAWECLLESRTPEGWATALDSLGTAVPEDRWAMGTILGVGIEREGDGFRRLFSSSACHILFPDGFLRPFQWRGVEGRIDDPTWHQQGPAVGYGRFGGTVDATCRVCGRPLHRLLGLDELPAGVLGPPEIVTCLSCLGWSESQLFFRHEEAGVRPVGPDTPQREPQFPADPFPETRVTFVASPPRWQLQDWGMSNSRENLHRVSGEPTWIQAPDFPPCPECGPTMSFLLQLDSLEVEGAGEWLWGSGGILYAFWCDRCSLSGTYWQCT